MLRRTYVAHVELPMQATIVLVAGLGESAATLRRVAGDVEETVARLRRPEVTSPIAATRGMFADAPGVPTLLPGEQITREALDYLQAVVRSGARLHGASDPSLQTVTVLTNGEQLQLAGTSEVRLAGGLDGRQR